MYRDTHRRTHAHAHYSLPPPALAGDEGLPYNFLVDNRGIPAWDARMQVGMGG